MEFLMRDDVNLSAEQWQSIDSAVIQAARNVLVGRKFLQIYGPLGAGAQSVNVDVLTPAEKGSVDFFGEEEEAVKVTGRSFKELPMIYRDFVLSWRDMEQARQDRYADRFGCGQRCCKCLRSERRPDDFCRESESRL